MHVAKLSNGDKSLRHGSKASPPHGIATYRLRRLLSGTGYDDTPSIETAPGASI